MDRRARLEWLRDELVATWDACEPANRAALAKQLRDTLQAIEDIPKVEAGDAVDEFSERLSRKRGAAAASGAAGGGKPRRRSG